MKVKTPLTHEMLQQMIKEGKERAYKILGVDPEERERQKQQKSAEKGTDEVS
jgi:hypothetical protein